MFRNPVGYGIRPSWRGRRYSVCTLSRYRLDALSDAKCRDVNVRWEALTRYGLSEALTPDCGSIIAGKWAFVAEAVPRNRQPNLTHVLVLRRRIALCLARR